MLKWLYNVVGRQEAITRDAWRRWIWQTAGFTPTPMQEDWLMDPVRVKQVAGGIRAGKSYSSARAMDWFTCIPNGLIWVIGPDYAQSRNEFRYMIQPYRDLNLLDDSKTSMPKEGSWQFQIEGGSFVETKSSDTLEKVAGQAPDAILVVEAGQQDEGIFSIVLGRALQKNAYVVFSGTFEGAFSWYADKWMEWQANNVLGAKSYSLPTWSNTESFPEGQDDPRFREFADAIPLDVYQEKIEAIPYKPSGLVFRDDFEEDKHMAPLVADPNKPIELAIDPAHHTYAILFVQWEDEYCHVLDEIYEHEVITQDIIPMVKNHPLFPLVTGGVIDVAARQRQANYSVMELWQRHAGLGLRASHTKIQSGIDAVKLRLKAGPDGQPRLLISDKLRKKRDYKGRAMGIYSELNMYSWGKQNPHASVRRVPVDAHNDALKALGYWLCDRYGHDVLRDWVMATETVEMNYPWVTI